MAGNIKGLTVEIGGDTSKLSKELTKLNRPINQMQGELKRVSQLLKMNPGNTALIRQKMELLSASVEETEGNLKELRAALQRASASGATEKNSAGFRRLQREITQTEARLKELAAEQARFAVQSSRIGVAAARMEQYGQKATAAGNSLRGLSIATGLLGGMAVRTTAEFDSSMSKVQAVSGATGGEFDLLRDKAREMGSKTKFSASEAAEAMNYMAMAGWKTKDMLSGIDGIMNLAAASGEDLATTSDIVTDGLTALGYSAKDAGRMADVMAAASSNANTNVSMMGETFKYAAAVAGSMGYSMEDVALATGLMANAGIKGSQAGTALRSTISRMAAPTKQVSAAMKSIGVEMTNADGTARPFRDVMVDLRKGMADLSETEKTQIASTIAGKNAMSGFLSIINASDSDFNKLADAIDNSDGAALKMAETMQDNLGGQVTILKSQMQELAISVGDTLVPMAKKAVKAAQNLTNWFNNLSAGGKDAAVKIGLMAGAAGPLLLATGGMAKAFSGSVKAIASAKGAIAAMTVVEGEATVATKLLGAAQKAVPWVAAAAGAALIAKAMVDTYKSTHQATLKVQEHAKARQEEIDAIKGEAKESDFYLQKLNELAGVEDKTNAQKELMQAYVDKLNGSVKDLNLTYDAEKDKLNQTTQAIRDKIQAQKEEAMAAAYQKNAKAALEEYVKQQMKASDEQRNYNQLKERWNNLSDSEKQTNGQLQQSMQESKRRLDDYNNSMSTALVDATKWQNQAAKNSGAWKQLTADAKAAGIQIPQSVKDGINSGKYVIPTTVAELEALIKFDNAATRAVGDGKKTADNLAAGMQEGTITAQEAAKALTDAVSAETSKAPGQNKTTGQQTGQSFNQGVSSQSGGAQAAGAGLKSSARSGASGGNLSGQGSSAGASYGAGVGSQRGSASEAGKSLKEGAKSGASGGSLHSIGAKLGEGLASGLKSALGAVKAAADKLVEEANRAAQAKAKIHSPSRLFRDEVGMPIAEGLAAGMQKGTPSIEAASKNMITAASNTGTASLTGGGMAQMKENISSSFDYAQIYGAMAAAVNQMEFKIILDQRELGRGMRGMGVSFE